MAATKRKSVRNPARKAVKKTVSKSKVKAVKSSKKVAKTTSTAKAPAKLSLGSIDKAFTKSKLYSTLADATGAKRGQVSAMFDTLKTIVNAHLKKQGPGKFTIPGLVKLTVTSKPATKARKGINPFTGEEMTFKAKPARKVVKVRALKELKNSVAQTA